jgi:hypothetical protein
MGRHANKKIHLANADQFAKKIIAKNAAIVQTKPPAQAPQILRKRNQKNW